jgi:enoyl-CoA hydratase
MRCKTELAQRLIRAPQQTDATIAPREQRGILLGLVQEREGPSVPPQQQTREAVFEEREHGSEVCAALGRRKAQGFVDSMSHVERLRSCAFEDPRRHSDEHREHVRWQRRQRPQGLGRGVARPQCESGTADDGEDDGTSDGFFEKGSPLHDTSCCSGFARRFRTHGAGAWEFLIITDVDDGCGSFGVACAESLLRPCALTVGGDGASPFGMSYENLLVEDVDAVRTITFQRPKALNALNRATLAELDTVLEATARDHAAGHTVRCVILTGAGEKAFIAGADITEFHALSAAEAASYSRRGHAVLDKLAALPLPVVAAVNGFALGGGLEVALACDFIWASENAKLGLVEANLGIIPGFGGVARLARRIGRARAAEAIFSAAQFSAEEALRVGLVNKVVPQIELLTEVRKLAAIIGSKGPVAVSLVKNLLSEGSDADLRTANAMEAHAFGVAFSTSDKAEGVSAFLEKRKAQFPGR